MKYKLVCFDVDGTLIDGIEFIWQHIHDYFQTDNAEREKWKSKFYAGKITYAQWAEHDIRMWQELGATKKQLIESIKGVNLVKGAKETVRMLKKSGVKIGVISGSIDFVLDYVFPDHPFDFVYMNRIVFNDDGTIKDIIPTSYDFEHKATALKEEAHISGIELEDTVFVGDHHNDIEAAKVAGFSIAFNCKDDQLKKVSSVSLDGDLSKILKYLKKDKKKK